MPSYCSHMLYYVKMEAQLFFERTIQFCARIEMANLLKKKMKFKRLNLIEISGKYGDRHSLWATR